MNKNWAYLMLCGPVLFWSGNFVLARAMSADIEPITLSFWRWMIALLVFLPFSVRALIRDWSIIKSKLPLLLLMGALGVAGFNTFVYLGVHQTTATNALLINSFIPIFIILLARIMLGGQMSYRKLLAVLISSLGVLILVVKGDIQNLLGLEINHGDLWILLAALFWAVYSICLRWRPLGLSSSAFLLFTMLVGVALLLPFYLYVLFQGEYLVLNTANLMTITYVALFPSIGAFLLWNQGVKMVGAPTAGQFIHLMPVIGTLMAVVFLGEHLYWFHFLGAIAIGFGVFLSLSEKQH
jgi:drug/metabolite transporter (DMT)-like permease